MCTVVISEISENDDTAGESSVTTGTQKVLGMVVLHCNGRTYGNAYLITFKVEPLGTHTCSFDPAIVGSTGGRLLLEPTGVRPSHSI